MSDAFSDLARRHGLLDQEGVSAEGLPERYLYSQDLAYRYAFGRWWGPRHVGSSDVWVLLNPATGDTEQRRRPTLARMIDRSRADGMAGVVVVNLFAHRHTDPRTLRSVSDPVGPANDDALRTLTKEAGRTIAAWGGGGRLKDRSAAVTPLLERPLCLGTTRAGQPRHPLYVPASAMLSVWRP